MFNLPFECKGEDLYRLASDFGEIKMIDIPIKNVLNKNKGIFIKIRLCFN